jgi:hypothetical protein
MLVFVTDKFAIDPQDVASLEAYEHWESDPSPSGSSWKDHDGTIIIQKNGRKTYLKGLSVKECHVLIFGKDVSEIKEVKLLPSVSEQRE